MKRFSFLLGCYGYGLGVPGIGDGLGVLGSGYGFEPGVVNIV
jgi:hypothetical protein